MESLKRVKKQLLYMSFISSLLLGFYIPLKMYIGVEEVSPFSDFIKGYFIAFFKSFVIISLLFTLMYFFKRKDIITKDNSKKKY